jgi:hypothetical protein
MTARIRSKAASALVVLGVALLAGCGDGSGPGSGDASTRAERHAAADKLIRQVHGPNPKASSGRIDATIDLNIKDSPRYGGLTQITADGVWNLPDGATVPDVELDVGLSLGGSALGGTLVIADGVGYIKLGDSGYKLPDAISRKLVAPAAAANNGLTKAAAMFYVNPQNWVKDAQLGADTSVAGVDVQRITGEIRPELAFLDLSRLVRFLTSIHVTQALGLPTALGPKLRAALVRSVTLAKGEALIGASDHVLRKAHLLGKAVVAPRDRKLLFGATSATLEATVDISDVGAPKQISVPTRLDPYSSLQLSLSALGEAVRRKTARAEDKS